jgi:hypothetical protein
MPIRVFSLVGFAIALVTALAVPGTASASYPRLNTTGSDLDGVAMSQWQGQANELYGTNIYEVASSSIVGLDSFERDG